MKAKIKEVNEYIELEYNMAKYRIDYESGKVKVAGNVPPKTVQNWISKAEMIEDPNPLKGWIHRIYRQK